MWVGLHWEVTLSRWLAGARKMELLIGSLPTHGTLTGVIMVCTEALDQREYQSYFFSEQLSDFDGQVDLIFLTLGQKIIRTPRNPTWLFSGVHFLWVFELVSRSLNIGLICKLVWHIGRPLPRASMDVPLHVYNILLGPRVIHWCSSKTWVLDPFRWNSTKIKNNRWNQMIFC